MFLMLRISMRRVDFVIGNLLLFVGAKALVKALHSRIELSHLGLDTAYASGRPIHGPAWAASGGMRPGRCVIG